MKKKLPELVVTKDGIPFADQAEGIRQFKEACCAPTRLVARPIDEYHEDMGPVLWWRFPIEEPPYCGSPLDLGHTVEISYLNGWSEKQQAMRVRTERIAVGGWPGYHTHFTTFEVPVKPPSMTLGEFVVGSIMNAADQLAHGPADVWRGKRELERWITRGGPKL